MSEWSLSEWAEHHVTATCYLSKCKTYTTALLRWSLQASVFHWLLSCPVCAQVKIWFQNKRSKFKKLMKQGGGSIDPSALSSSRLSTGSPTVAPVWSSPTTVKTSVGSTGSYIPSYTSWYPATHQESMQQSQLMWANGSDSDSGAACAPGRGARSGHAQPPEKNPRTDPGFPHRDGSDWLKAHDEPEGDRSVPVDGSRNKRGSFWLLFVIVSV